MNTSKLHDFSQGVAAATFDIHKNEATEERLGIDFVALLALIEAIGQTVMTLINNCPNKSNLKNAVKNPSWLQRIRFRAALKEHLDVSGHFKLRALAGKAADNCFKEVARLTDDELELLLQETQNDPDNWLL